MLLGMFSGLAQLPQGHCFCFYRVSNASVTWKNGEKKEEGEAALCNFSVVVLFAAFAFLC